MNIRLTLLLVLLPLSVSPTGPLISRHVPSFASDAAQAVQMPQMRPTVSIASRALHASHSSNFIDEPREMYKFDGLMEMGGLYDFHEMTASAKEAIPGLTSPFYRETGGDTLSARQLLFGAQSSVALYGLDLVAEIPVSSELRCGLTLPLIHVEARQRYQFPVMSSDQAVSAPQVEQTHRFRQALHKDLGMVQKDWVLNSVGDLTGWAEYVKTWGYVWLLRTIQVGGRLSISGPTAKAEDVAYPASFALGNPGSWGFALSLISRFEVKESIWFQSPLTLVAQSVATREQRLPAYAEPMAFGVIKGKVKTVPGLTLSWEPSLTMQHFIDNVHLFLGFSLTKHYADRFYDLRLAPSTPSFLTRTSLPDDSAGSTLDTRSQINLTNMNRGQKREYSAWKRSYIMLGAQYELVDLFPKLKHVPTLNLGLNYCIGATRAARMHQISAGLSWRF
ncbi:MAG: hypothetical protein QG604_250 [Candidatus Dependentiae bacterium]|nr:hypothetical protein [Candidatus Dependentiae bacterium]